MDNRHSCLMCLCVCCEQVIELKKQVEQIKQQGDSMVFDDLSTDQGDTTFRVGHTVSSDNKQKEKIRQIERQRREAQDVSSFYCRSLTSSTNHLRYSMPWITCILRHWGLILMVLAALDKDETSNAG